MRNDNLRTVEEFILIEMTPFFGKMLSCRHCQLFFWSCCCCFCWINFIPQILILGWPVPCSFKKLVSATYNKILSTRISEHISYETATRKLEYTHAFNARDFLSTLGSSFFSKFEIHSYIIGSLYKYLPPRPSYLFSF